MDGDNIYVRMASDYACRLVDSVNSGAVLMHVDSSYMPSITITATPGIAVPPGTTVTFMAAVTGAGPSPSYQWYKNGLPIPGATTGVYSTNSLTDKDSISLGVLGTLPCGTWSNGSVIMSIQPTSIDGTSGSTDNITVVPNPTKGELLIKGTLRSNNDQPATYQITNVLGQVIYTRESIVKESMLRERIELGNTLTNGMYLLNIRCGNEQKTIHFILER
jgi:hypothetical protein